MSCWVAPSVAAELWGISVSQVLQGIGSGEIPTKSELGFTLVDVAPDRPQRNTQETPRVRPLTFVTAVDPSDATQGEEFNWRPARMQAARQRRAPMPRSLAA